MTSSIGRLKKRPEFLRVAGAGRKWVSPGFVLQARLRREGVDRDDGASGLVRFGLTASRKVGGAVVRNRARRRLRSAAVEVLPEAGCAGYDYVLIARAATVRRPFQELVRDLRVAVERVVSKEPRSGAAGSRKPRPSGRGRR